MANSAESKDDLAQFNPNITLKMIESFKTEIQNLIVDDPAKAVTNLTDLIEEKLLPALIRTSTEMLALGESIMEHEERLCDIEDEDANRLDPEAAEKLITHLTTANAIFEKMLLIKPNKEVKQMIENGKQLINFITSITVEEEGDDDQGGDDESADE